MHNSINNKFYIYLIVIFSIIINLCKSQIYDNNGEFICRGDLIYRDSKNRIDDEKIGYNFVKFNETYVDCVLPCPSPFFKIDQWTKFLNMSTAMGTISFFCGLFLLVTYSPLVNKTQNRHSIGICCMAFGVTLAMSTDMWNYGYNFTDNSVCPSPGQYLTQSNARCLSSGAFLQFGGVFGFLNWTLLSFDLLMNIRKTITKNYDRYYFLGSFIISIIFTFVPIHADQYSMSYIGLGCWIGTYQIFFFWVPLSICLILSTIFVILILKEIYSIVKASKQDISIHGNIIRPLICITLTGFAFFYMFFYYISVAADQQYYQNVLDEYTNCLMDPTIEDPSECTAAKLSVAGQFIFLFSLRLLGIGAFIFYGINKNVKNIYLNSFWFNNKFVHNYISKKSNRDSIGKGNVDEFSNKLYNGNVGDNSISVSNSNNVANYNFESSIIEMSTNSSGSKINSSSDEN